MFSKRSLSCFWLLVVAVIFLPSIVLAQTQESTTLSVTVPSHVDTGKSTFVSDLTSLPADGTSLVTLTATVVDSTGTPLANLDATVTSNRGDVDLVQCYAGNTLLTVNKTTTDAQGIARCVSSSYAPGDATYTALVDTVTLNDKPTVTFTPLPTINNLNVTVTLPGGKKLTLLQPPKAGPPSPTPTPGVKSPPSGKKLVNTGIEIQIPFWVFLLILFFITTEPILLILVLRLSRKLRRGFDSEKKAIKKEEDLLAKIYFLEKSLAEHEVKASRDLKLNKDLEQLKQIDQNAAQPTNKNRPKSQLPPPQNPTAQPPPVNQAPPAGGPPTTP